MNVTFLLPVVCKTGLIFGRTFHMLWWISTKLNLYYRCKSIGIDALVVVDEHSLIHVCDKLLQVKTSHSGDESKHPSRGSLVDSIPLLRKSSVRKIKPWVKFWTWKSKFTTQYLLPALMNLFQEILTLLTVVAKIIFLTIAGRKIGKWVVGTFSSIQTWLTIECRWRYIVLNVWKVKKWQVIDKSIWRNFRVNL